jgi:hypothetical protein
MVTRVLGRRFGPLLVAAGILGGCASTGSHAGNGSAAGNGSTTRFTQDDQCKREGGSWTGTRCEFSGAGGGGY